MNKIYPALLLLILLGGISYAACPEPDIKVYSACTEACPNMVDRPLAASDCVNKCIAMWNKMQDDHYECAKLEREQAEQKQLEKDNKLRGIEEAKIITVSTVEGMIWLTNSQGLVNKLSNSELLDMKPGSILRSDPDSTAVVVIKEGGRLQLGPDSQFTYVGGEPIIEGEPEKMKYTYEVSTGRVRYTSEDPNTQYEVHTSQGTVVNRQTDFIVEADNVTSMSAFYLYEGILDVNTTNGETYVLNTGEMITIGTDGKAVISSLSIEDWDGLVKNIETGEEFTPSWKLPAETSTAEPEPQGDVLTEPAESRTGLYIILSIIVIAIAIGSIIRAKVNKK